MDLKYVEMLAKEAKNGDNLSKENLIEEFRPFIRNLSRKTFIHGYDKDDIENECYKNLFKCLNSYDLEKHRFVAYATNGIKNNLNDLIRKTKNRDNSEGSCALTLSDNLEDALPSNEPNLEDMLCNECDLDLLKYAIKKLTKEEQELIDFIFFKNNTIRLYSNLKDMCYSTAAKRKMDILKKINKIFSSFNEVCVN
ncbi:sigma-70 family RNA polymerase sigma factor [Clostridium botulinum]|uniref:Sigma-70 family RNA polymerase sigma factor n=1 Tax=Clostridium botulinum TaxID=1491 RepID=A0A6B4JJT5_CLOBO|nr:sigma-70 family RNA polymerase sigma factor [Clostridium botulinum]EES48873.1 sigma-70 region 2 domain protein [Clostridium botulinum E1 str. 'BoNT E Beluga']MBY6760183.1 sigma-70 family RNA polymerase sigma factor [Clostridium botulinum]MBY6919091.1 sigma-70 family RNA polymerase sigma factor [Clostridium botulinum]MCR1132184.1 sigma-70 family RNA polymerase sigma factor [Clostridium botulinum]NFH70937.1 sigma-70 family RNA polymerase sigma factor [Clostridium botulinum]